MAGDPAEWIARRLPPRPDPRTGQPRPPAAPRMWSGGVEAETDPARRPEPPPGEGPVLEWFRESRRATHKVAALGFAVLIVLFTIIHDRELAWMIDGWFAVGSWALIAAGVALLYAGGRAVHLAAGAEWFAYKGGWVRTYDLVEVKLKARGAVMDLCLKDTAGRRAEAELRIVEMNPRLWDLVYNGILHSAHARPVETNRQSRGRLRLPANPAWKRAQDASTD